MDGNTAIQKCEEKTYDLLLLDHMMPKPDGIETLHLIRADEERTKSLYAGSGIYR